MAIKLAFSTVACPDWTLEKVAQQAAEMGYKGVELRTLGAGSRGLASDPALSDPMTIRRIFEAEAVEPICLSTSWALSHDDPSVTRQTHWQVKHDLELASQIGCSLLRVFGCEMGPGGNRNITQIADQITELAQTASDLGVDLLLENVGSMAKAKQWWSLLNVVDHPRVGLCWNVANAAAAGESSNVSVPMLNRHIRLAKVKDTRVGEGSGFVPLGEGSVGIESFVKRLLGVGYDGYISVEWDRLWLPSLVGAEEYLPDAHQRLTGWLDLIAQALEKGARLPQRRRQRTPPSPPPKPARTRNLVRGVGPAGVTKQVVRLDTINDE